MYSHLPHQPQPAQKNDTIHVIPFPRNEDVIRRRDLVEKLDMLLPQTPKFYSAALWGLGGSGKTQIALDYAYQRCEDRMCSIFWVHANTEATFMRDYKAIAIKLGIDKSLDNKDMLNAVRDGIEAKPMWVLIIDNADDLSLFGIGRTTKAVKDGLYRYMPKGPAGTILWTSRDAHIAGTLVDSQRSIEVASMTYIDAITLLETRRNDTSPQTLSHTMSLVEELQRLPLAISQAGAYMRRMSMTTEGYLSMLRHSERRWEALKVNEWSRHRRPEVPNSVLETWWVTIERIQDENNMAYQILHVIAYLYYGNLPHKLISTIITHISGNMTAKFELSDVMLAMVRLKEFSFLKVQGGEHNEPGYKMHKLIQEAVRYRLSVQELSNGNAAGFPGQGTSLMKMERASEAYYSGIAIQVISELFPHSKPESWEQCERYLAHAISVMDWVEICGKYVDISALFSRVSKYLYDRGRWTEKELVDQKGLKLMQRGFGEMHPNTTQGMSNLAITYSARGRYDEAETLIKKALYLQREMHREKHSVTIRCMANLAVIYYKQGNYYKAEALEKEVLIIRQEIFGDKHPDTLRSVANLALIYLALGCYEKAEILEKDAVDLQRKILGEYHPDTIRSMANLGAIYHKQGWYNEAVILKKQAVEVQRKVFGEAHPDTAQYMANLAATYHKQGRYNEDEKISIKVLDIRRQILGNNHPDTLQSIQDLAITLSIRGRTSDASSLMRECLQRSILLLGPRHPLTQRSVQLLQKWESRQSFLKVIIQWFNGSE